MEIRILLPRLRWIIVIGIIVALVWSGTLSIRLPWQASPAHQASGGADASTVASAMRDIDRERVRQAVLERREEILRYQLRLLEDASDGRAPGDAAEAREHLLAIIRERAASEKILLQSLEQLWLAEGTASTNERLASGLELLWPVSPRRGISAHFEDEEYERHFGFAHHAIDIPTPKNTVIHAPADGIVTKVAMNGMGYSYVVMQHADGMETIYGHILAPIAAEGDMLRAGDPVAHTGGAPGEPGTGPYSTGPHLHFAVRIGGVLVDPLLYLVQ